MRNTPEGCKPFNLQEALAGKPVVTRDGRKVKIAGYNPEFEEYHKVIGWMDSKVIGFNEFGSWHGPMSDNDLFMAPETKDVWVLLYESEGIIHSYVSDTEDKAKEKVEWLNYTYTNLGIHKITVTV